MSVRVMVSAMVAGSAFVIALASRHHAPPSPPARPDHPDVQWLTPQAASQIIGDRGELGPLFAGVYVGGPAPDASVRERIASFARANHVAIDLDVADGQLAAVRFAVTFGGCCGYEGADVLALRLQRPRRDEDECEDCEVWVDDWASISESGSVYMRARVRVNRVSVRWEPALNFAEVLERADALLGARAPAVADAERQGWTERGVDRYLVETPFPWADSWEPARESLGLSVAVERGRVSEVSFDLRDVEDEQLQGLRARWGRPHVAADGTWSWRKPDRVVIAEVDWPRTITIRKR